MTIESVLITGTTSGVGLALLEHYAARHTKVVAVNRRCIPELEARFPDVRFQLADVRDPVAVNTLMTELTRAGDLPDVFFLNAGINRIDNDETFDLSAYREVLETNLYGVLAFVEPLTRLATGSTPRHIVVIGSMAGRVGNPYALGFHTSKRAVSACFETWARMYTDTDLVFQQVLLGPVGTEIFTMADRLPKWMVALRDACSAPASVAASAIAAFAETKRRALWFPRRSALLFLGMWLARSTLPGFFQGRSTLSGRVRREKSSGSESQQKERSS